MNRKYELVYLASPDATEDQVTEGDLIAVIDPA